MCGIIGLLRWQGLESGDADAVKRGADALRHRGPDAEGFWNDPHCALGFRRLKVQDLSDAGQQPMANEDQTIQVVFNGEIYNFIELREQLKAQAHVFHSDTDTEVLVHGYEEWGLEVLLQKIRGMYAFAIWDQKIKTLHLVRDPVGVKPLYFAERNGCVVFASEPKALFATGVVQPELDPVALHEALTYRYVPPPRSGFRDVEKLPPGNVATAAGGTLGYRAWWKWSESKTDKPDAEAFRPEQLQERLGQATRRRLRADVPMGVWLSGGIDSGLILSQMGSNEQAVKTFCAGFKQAAYDERELAGQAATQYKAEHQSFEVPADLFRYLPQIVWHADEPFFDSSCLPVFHLSQETKRHVTVALSGDGGDEAFGGYERYAGMQWLTRWKGMPKWMRKAAVAFAVWRHPIPSRQGWDRLLRWLKKCADIGEAGYHPYLGAQSLFDQAQIQALFSEKVGEEVAEVDGREYLSHALLKVAKKRYPTLPPKAHPLDVGLLRQADLETYLPGDVLHKTDRMSMAHGLEVRSPFLDVDYFTWALDVPDESLLQGRKTKPLLRQLAEKLLPADVAHARKRGFGVPLDDWFRGPLKKQAAEIFDNSYLVADGVFKPQYWEPFWDSHQEGTGQHGERLYALLALECWYRIFLSGELALERPEPLA